jgi:hypothetical protein
MFHLQRYPNRICKTLISIFGKVVPHVEPNPNQKVAHVKRQKSQNHQPLKSLNQLGVGNSL